MLCFFFLLLYIFFFPALDVISFLLIDQDCRYFLFSFILELERVSRIGSIQKIGSRPTSFPEMQQLLIRTRSPNHLLTTCLSPPCSLPSCCSSVVDAIGTEGRVDMGGGSGTGIVDGTSHQGSHGPLSGQEVVSCEWEAGA